jgi:hypothetical protein
MGQYEMKLSTVESIFPLPLMEEFNTGLIKGTIYRYEDIDTARGALRAFSAINSKVDGSFTDTSMREYDEPHHVKLQTLEDIIEALMALGMFHEDITSISFVIEQLEGVNVVKVNE